MKSWLRYLKDWGYVIAGAVLYKMTGKNHEFCYQAMIRLYCKTNGRSAKWISKCLSWLYPAKLRSPVSGVLGSFTDQKLSAITEKINTDGFHVFEQRLSEDLLQDFMRFTRETQAILRRHDNESESQQSKRAIYNAEVPQAVRYDYASAELMKSPVVQKLVSDPSILAVARSYLGVEPVIDIVTMWWHTDFQKGPDSNAAQFFHFDMERVKWLKFFFYVTDVTADTGPHCFIRGTHDAKNIPKSILERGYVRISDEDMKKYFNAKDFIEFEGPRGTVIAEDTSGLHKGKHVHKGGRLVFQLEFAVSMFGSPNTEKFMIHDVRIPELQQMIEESPRVYKNFFEQKNESHIHG